MDHVFGFALRLHQLISEPQDFGLPLIAAQSHGLAVAEKLDGRVEGKWISLLILGKHAGTILVI